MLFASTARCGLACRTPGKPSWRGERQGRDRRCCRGRLPHDPLAGARLELALIVQARRDAPMLDWIVECLGKERSTRRSGGRCSPAARRPKERARGALVCSCFAVRRDAIAEAVRAGALSVEAVGELLKAGTNCGSCRPEIKRVIGDGKPRRRQPRGGLKPTLPVSCPDLARSGRHSCLCRGCGEIKAEPLGDPRFRSLL